MRFPTKCILVSLFAVVCIVAWSRSQAEDMTHLAMIAKALNSTVFIKVQKDGKTTGHGSGVIISEDGNILTNYHVVHRAEGIKVWLHKDRGRRHHKAEVVGIDPVADLAVIKITPWPDEVLIPASLEPIAASVYPGILVYAVGHPLSLPWSVTKGVVNQVNRPSFITPYVNLIQHDAVIQEGSSGGPLFNTRGYLIGINTYVIAPTSGTLEPKRNYSGMGYAVQADTIAFSLVQMMTTGVVKRAALKLNIINLNEELRDWIFSKEEPDPYIPNTFGMIMNFIEKDGYAHKQGMRNFDTIVSIDGYPVNDMKDAARIILTKKPGEIAILLIIRQGEFELISYLLSSIEMPMSFYDDEKNATDPYGRPPTEPEEEEKNPKPSSSE